MSRKADFSIIILKYFLIPGNYLSIFSAIFIVFKKTNSLSSILDVIANRATTVFYGGDSASAIDKAGVADKVSHVLTGGYSSRDFMEGKVLPGVAALKDR